MLLVRGATAGACPHFLLLRDAPPLVLMACRYCGRKMDTMNEQSPIQFQQHQREYNSLAYAYPVISRRAKGLSIGVNLNPDKVCNWDCPYCQVDRTTPAKVTQVDEDQLIAELRQVANDAISGALWQHPRFASTPQELRVIRDFAFAGDGEPTSYQGLASVLGALIAMKRELGLEQVPINILTNASLFHLKHVQAGLALLADVPSDLWCKLDAGTQEYFEQVNRSKFKLEHCYQNTLWLAKQRPITIQSMFLRMDGEAMSEDELNAYLDRLAGILREGGPLKQVQVYTIARVPSEDRCQPLKRAEVDAIAARVRKVVGDVPVVVAYGTQD